MRLADLSNHEASGDAEAMNYNKAAEAFHILFHVAGELGLTVPVRKIYLYTHGAVHDGASENFHYGFFNNTNCFFQAAWHFANQSGGGCVNGRSDLLIDMVLEPVILLSWDWSDFFFSFFFLCTTTGQGFPIIGALIVDVGFSVSST